jgi:hypothetical protein
MVLRIIRITTRTALPVETPTVPAPRIWVRMEQAISKTVKVVVDLVVQAVVRTEAARDILVDLVVAPTVGPVEDLAVRTVDPEARINTADLEVMVDKVEAIVVVIKVVDALTAGIIAHRVADSNLLNPEKSTLRKFRIKSGKPSLNWLELPGEERA